MSIELQGTTVTHIVSGDLWAGAEFQVYTLCQQLNDTKTVIPTVIVFNAGILFEKLKGLGITVTLADEQTLGPISIARLIAQHCKKNRTDVVHTHGFKENILGIIGKELARVPFSVRTVHGNSEISSAASGPYRRAINNLDILLSRTRHNAIIAVSTQLEQSLSQVFPGKVRKIFNFINVKEIRDQRPADIRKDLSELYIGIIGRLVPVKRIDLFIRTIAVINDQGRSCTGVVVGDGPLCSHLLKLAGELDIQHKIVFRGFLDSVVAELVSMDALLMTSDHEGLPMTLLEALALEVPIVAHNTGGIPEVLANGQAGYLVNDHSPAGYAQAIESALNQPDLVKAKTAYGLNRVLDVFDVKVQTEEYVALYSQLS